jgi:hypothetical protein
MVEAEEVGDGEDLLGNGRRPGSAEAGYILEAQSLSTFLAFEYKSVLFFFGHGNQA